MCDREGKTDDERTVIREKGNKRVDQVGSRGGTRIRREITLHKELTDHPLNTYLALSLQYARVMNKKKCWVCSHLPHSSKHGLPLFAVPLQGGTCVGT